MVLRWSQMWDWGDENEFGNVFLDCRKLISERLMENVHPAETCGTKSRDVKLEVFSKIEK